MAHFARINESGIVEEVIVIKNDEAPDPAPDYSEPLGQEFIASLGLAGTWLQTSYSGSFRGKYAGIGFTYDAERDRFIPPHPYPSWTLDEDDNWQPPIPKPSDENGPLTWDENTQSWVEGPALT